MASKKIDLTGRRFGRLVVVEETPIKKRKIKGYIYWNCRCGCGGTKSVKSDNLRYGHTRSCGCLGNGRNTKYKDAIEAGLYHKLNTYKRSAVVRNLVFSLTYEQFSTLICSPCHYCGGLPSNEIKTRKEAPEYITVNGIDRKDNSIGYTLDNCVPCCSSCNYLKGTLSEDEFKSSIQRIYEYLYINKIED